MDSAPSDICSVFASKSHLDSTTETLIYLNLSDSAVSRIWELIYCTTRMFIWNKPNVITIEIREYKG